jgi:hypothetical protein
MMLTIALRMLLQNRPRLVITSFLAGKNGDKKATIR